jgi:cell division protein FtsB
MLILLALIQYPLWLGKGGWLRVYELDQQVNKQLDKNDALAARNAKLAGEVKDLKEGTKAIEERARMEHGMIKDKEIFIQVVPNKKANPSTDSTSGNASGNPTTAR